jgi:SAM-dependent methyltransferase
MYPVRAVHTDKCFICEDGAGPVVWRENGVEARRCRCGMVYAVTHREVITDDLMKEHHTDDFYSYPATFKANWMAKHCPKGKLLEVGSGNSFFLREARRLGYKIEGLEPDRERAAQVSGELGIPVSQEFIEATRLPSGHYDVIYHCDLLVHFPDPILALKKMTSLLSPGGVLCFEVGLLGGISPLWYRMTGEIGLGPHLWLYSAHAFDALLSRSGLQVIHLQHFGLAAEVIGSRVNRVLVRRVLGPLLNAMQWTGLTPPPQSTTAVYGWLQNFLRYHVGRFAPRVGPATLLVVARPIKHAP